jgi:hypothetical protein
MIELKSGLQSITDKGQWASRGASFVTKVKATKAVWFPPEPSGEQVASSAQKTAKKAARKTTAGTRKTTAGTRKTTAAARKTSAGTKNVTNPVRRKKA